MPPSGPQDGDLPCGLASCILNEDVLPLPIEILDRDVSGEDVPSDRRDELAAALSEAEGFYRDHCHACRLAGSSDERDAKLGLFTLADKALSRQADPEIVDCYRQARRARKRLEADLEQGQVVLASDLSRALRSQERLAERSGDVRNPPLQALLDREQRRARAALSRTLAEEANVAALVDALPHLRGAPEEARDPTAELAFLETWERRVRIVGDDLVEAPDLQWVHEEQSALPASRVVESDGAWNRSQRIVAEASSGPRLVVEAILETDLARGEGDLAALVTELTEHRRRGASTHGYHHVVGFVRNGDWPDEIRRLARQLAPSEFAPGRTSLVLSNLDARSMAPETEHMPPGLKFIYHPSSNERLLEEVQQVTEDALRTEGFVEIDALEETLEIPRSAIRWSLERLPLAGRITTIEDVGEIYRRGILEG